MSTRAALVRGLSGELQGELQGEQGYLMVALLVALSVMAIMMGAALPAWHTLAQREKEAELIFRGEQYARAIGLWQRRFANAAPPSIDVLVEQRFLRKKYKDPITNDEFQVLGPGTALPGQTQSPLTGQVQSGQALGAFQQVQSVIQAAGRATAAPRQVNVTQGRGGDNGIGAGIVGGIVGVTSKSAEKSLRLYNSRDTYNQWIFMPVARAGGAGGAGAGVRGAGGRGDGRGADGRGVLDGRGRGPQGDGGRGGFDGRGRGPQGDGGRGGAGGRGGQAPPRGRF
jgi:type II secretory pathway pseudopilin PulG